MKKTIINIAIILGIVAITFGATRQFFPKTKQVVQTDTTYIDKPYPVEKIVEKEVPVTVTKWKTDTVKVESVRVEKDTVFITTPSNIFNYHTSFLTQYPYAPKFLGLNKEKGNLKLTLLNTSGKTESKTWNISNWNYKIGFENKNVALQKTNRIKEEFEYDIGVGWIQYYNNGYPFVNVSGHYKILGIDVNSSLYLSEKPFVTFGVKYEIN